MSRHGVLPPLVPTSKIHFNKENMTSTASMRQTEQAVASPTREPEKDMLVIEEADNLVSFVEAD
jgi:hypothetical protein